MFHTGLTGFCKQSSMLVDAGHQRIVPLSAGLSCPFCGTVKDPIPWVGKLEIGFESYQQRQDGNDVTSSCRTIASSRRTSCRCCICYSRHVDTTHGIDSIGARRSTAGNINRIQKIGEKRTQTWSSLDDEQRHRRLHLRRCQRCFHAVELKMGQLHYDFE